MIFQLDDLTISPEQPLPGEAVTITAHVTNLAKEATEYVAVRCIDSGASAIQSPTLDRNRSTPVVFTVRPEPGTHSVRIDRLVGTFTMGGEGWGATPWIFVSLLSALAAGGVLILIAAYWHRQRRRPGNATFPNLSHQRWMLRRRTGQ